MMRSTINENVCVDFRSRLTEPSSILHYIALVVLFKSLVV